MVNAARDYLARGWRVIPVPVRSKKPTIAGWPALRLDDSTLPEYFNGQPSNIGGLLGEPSGGLTDVDLDCGEAMRLPARFLPTTRSIFGRASKRRSHWLYYADPIIPTEKFEDLTGAMLVELRSTGAQTILPGSVNPSGEAVEWDEDGEVAHVPGVTLRAAVAQLAAACLVARHWPATGARHDASLATAGLLARGGLDEARCVLLVQAAAEAAGDEEARDRRRDVTSGRHHRRRPGKDVHRRRPRSRTRRRRDRRRNQAMSAKNIIGKVADWAGRLAGATAALGECTTPSASSGSSTPSP